MKRIEDTELQGHLKSLGACPEARLMAGERAPQQAWDECDNPAWLYWWACRTNRNTESMIILSSCDVARMVLHLVPAGEDRPRLAIEAAERWAKNQTKSAWAAAWAAADAAAWAAAWAAWAAAWAARAADAAAVGAAADAAVAAAVALIGSKYVVKKLSIIHKGLIQLNSFII